MVERFELMVAIILIVILLWIVTGGPILWLITHIIMNWK